MSKSILPDGYLSAEFLESTGTQYINTGIRPFTGAEKCTVGMEIDCLATGPGSNTNCMIAGCGQSGGGWFSPYRWWTEDAAYVSIYLQQHAYPVSSPYNNRIRCSLNFLESGVIKYSANGGDVLTKAITHTVKSYNRNIWLFGGDQTNVTPRAAARIWSAKISDGAALVRSYVPAISPAGVACMYDSVTMTPKYNAGSGSFIVGVSTEQTYALIDKLPVLATNSNFALTISLPYTAQYDTRLVDALNTTIDLYKVNLTVTYSDATTARALSIKEAYALPDILPKLKEETASTLSIILPYRAKYDTALLAALEELATTLYWTITIYYDSPVYPEDFHPAEFIDSDGTAYLDIPIATDCTDKAIKVRTQHLFDAASSGVTYGEGVSSGANATTLNWSRVNTLFGGFAGNSSVTLQNPTLYTDKYNTIELEVADNATKLAINGRTATAIHTDSTELPEVISQIGVFHTYGSAALLPGKKRFWQLTLDDKVFYNLVPALTWEGVPCMVNTLTNEFYTTAGTADFTIGLSEEQAYTVLPILLTTATTLPSITLPYCARANKKIQALLSEFETTDWVSYSDPVYPDDCIAITSVMQNGTLVDTSGVIPCIIIGDSWTNTIWTYDLNLKEFVAVFPEYVAVISTEELRAIINRLENYISIATANTSFSVQLPYSAQFDTELQTKLIEFTMQSGYGVDVTYSNPIDHEDYIPATYLESSGEDSIRLENPEDDGYNEYTGVRAQLAAVEKNEYNYLFYNFNAFESLGLGVSEDNVWRAAYSTMIETTAPAELNTQTTIEFNYKDSRQLNIGPAYRQTLSKWDADMGFNFIQLFFPSQFASSNVTGWKLKAWRILFSHYGKVIHDLNPGITYDGIPCFVDVINNITHRVPSYAIGMTVTQLRNLRKLPATTYGILNIQLPKYAVLDAEADAAIMAAEENGWVIKLGDYIPALFLESTRNQFITVDRMEAWTAWSLTTRRTNLDYAGALKQGYSANGGKNAEVGVTHSGDSRGAYAAYLDAGLYGGGVLVGEPNSGLKRFTAGVDTARKVAYLGEQQIPITSKAKQASVFYLFATFQQEWVPHVRYTTRGAVYHFSYSSGGSRVSLRPVIDPQGVPCMWDSVRKTGYYAYKTSVPGKFAIGMTAAQARQLRYLPEAAEDKTLTVSLPPDVVDENGVLQDMAIFTALSVAEDKGWSFILRTHDGSAVYITLPPSYMECAFLESTGTQNIKLSDTVDRDTGLMATYQTGEGKRWAYHYCYCTEKPSALAVPFGGDHPDQYYNKWVWCWYKWTFTDLPIPSPSDEYGPDYYTKRLTGAVNWKVSKGAEIQFEGASSQKVKSWYDSFVETYTGLTLCASSYKTYSIKVSQKQNITRDMVPAIAPSGVPCMFDKATQQPFYNAGTGSFIVGMTAAQARRLNELPEGGGTLTISLPPDVVDENGVLQDMEIFTALSAAVDKGWSFILQTHDGTAVETAVPAGYMECDFLESTGEQYIKTAYCPFGGSDIETKVRFCDNISATAFSSVSAKLPTPWEDAYFVTKYHSGLENKGGGWMGFGKTNANTVVYVNFQNTHLYRLNSSGCYQDGVKLFNSVSIAERTQYPVYLFARNFAGVTELISAVRMWNFTVQENASCVLDLVPAIAPNGEPCMFDRVWKTSLYNAGGGAFIVGMTAAQARQLWKLPVEAEDKTLTVSLPATIVDGETVTDDAVQTALDAAAAKGWTITIQTYTES